MINVNNRFQSFGRISRNHRFTICEPLRRLLGNQLSKIPTYYVKHRNPASVHNIIRIRPSILPLGYIPPALFPRRELEGRARMTWARAEGKMEYFELSMPFRNLA